MTRPVIILGGGGHAKVLAAALKLAEYQILGIVDNNPQLHGTHILDVEIIGSEDLMDRFPPHEIFLVNAIGSVQQPQARKSLYDRFKALGYRFVSVVHSSSVISEGVKLGEGVQIMAGVVIQPDCTIGDNSIVNTGVTIDHDCFIGDHVHLAPGVTLSGNVEIGNDSHLGTGSSVIQQIKIGERCLLGAGSVVLKNLPADTVAYGVPAKVVS